MKELSAADIKGLDADQQSELIAELIRELRSQESARSNLEKAVDAAKTANTLWKTGTIVVGVLVAFATATIFVSGMFSDWRKLTAAHRIGDETFDGLNHTRLPSDDLDALAEAIMKRIDLGPNIDPKSIVRYGDEFRIVNDDQYEVSRYLHSAVQWPAIAWDWTNPGTGEEVQQVTTIPRFQDGGVTKDNEWSRTFRLEHVGQ